MPPIALEAVLLHEEVQVLHGGELVARHLQEVLPGTVCILDVWRGAVVPEGVFAHGDGHQAGLDVDAATSLEDGGVDAFGALEARSVIHGMLHVGWSFVGVGACRFEGELVNPVANLRGNNGKEGTV